MSVLVSRNSVGENMLILRILEFPMEKVVFSHKKVKNPSVLGILFFELKLGLLCS